VSRKAFDTASWVVWGRGLVWISAAGGKRGWFRRGFRMLSWIVLGGVDFCCLRRRVG
jgi:hypothetical protein